MPETTLSNAQIHSLKIPPGPRGHFLLGSLPEVQRDALKFLMDIAREYGDIARYRFWLFSGCLLNHPDYIKYVLQENNHNFDKQTFSFRMIKPVVGEGLLTSQGDFWLRQRRLIQPAFHRQRIAGFGRLMTEKTQEMLARWELEYSDRPFDVSHEMMRLTLTIVGKALFSQDVGPVADVIGASFTVLNEDISKRLRSLLSPPLSWPTPANRRFHAALNKMDRLVQELIHTRRAEIAQGKMPSGDKQDLLSLLILASDEETGLGMDDQQLRDEITTLMLAGHETTATALSWTWYLLSKNPLAAQRLDAELDRVLGGRLPTADDLSDLTYTRWVIQETLRLYPPAWIIDRRAVQGDEIGGYFIPANSVVSLSPYVTHRHPAFWENPEGFDPERFSPERFANIPQYAYFPFGGGPRLCIGRDFALVEAQLILATITQQFRLDLVPGYPVQPDPLITLRPKNGLQVTLHKR